MAIEKVTSNFLSHEPEIPLYSRFLNDTLNGIKDIGALGLYVYLGSKPEDWEIIDTQLMAHFGKGRDAIKNAFKYLKTLGLIKKEPIKDSKGRITAWTTSLKRQITEIPYCGVESKLIEQSVGESTLLKNHTLDFPDAGESAPTNNIYIQIKEKELEIKDLPKKEEAEVIDVNYEHPETYYPLPDISGQAKFEKMNMAKLVFDNPFHFPEPLIAEWLAYRQKMRYPVSQTVWDEMKKELHKCKDPLAAFRTMIVSGWKSFKAEYVEKDLKRGLDNSTTEWISKVSEDLF